MKVIMRMSEPVFMIKDLMSNLMNMSTTVLMIIMMLSPQVN